MSTFDPSIHGKPDTLIINHWKGEGVQILHKGEVVVQGRSFGDVLRTLSQFFGVEIVSLPKPPPQ